MRRASAKTTTPQKIHLCLGNLSGPSGLFKDLRSERTRSEEECWPPGADRPYGSTRPVPTHRAVRSKSISSSERSQSLFGKAAARTISRSRRGIPDGTALGESASSLILAPRVRSRGPGDRRVTDRSITLQVPVDPALPPGPRGHAAHLIGRFVSPARNGAERLEISSPIR